MDSPLYPLPALERRLRERAQRVLPDGENVLAAIVVTKGPRPGAEGWLAWLAGLLGPMLSLIGVAGIVGSRANYTIALTDRGVVLLRNRRLRHPSAVVSRTSDLGTLGPFNEFDGDPWVEFLGARYWMYGFSSFEAYTMRRLIGTRPSGPSGSTA